MNINNAALLDPKEADFQLRSIGDFIAIGKFDRAAVRAQDAKLLLGTPDDDNMTAADRAWYRAEFSLIIARKCLVDGDTSNMANALLDGINGLNELGKLDGEKWGLKLGQLNYLLGLARLADPADDLDITDGFEALDRAIAIFDDDKYVGLSYAEKGLACAQTVRYLALIKLHQSDELGRSFGLGYYDEVQDDLELLYHNVNTTRDLEFQAIVVAHVAQRFFMNSFRDDAIGLVKLSRNRLMHLARNVRRCGWRLSTLALRLRLFKPDCQDPELWNLVRHSI